MSDIPNSNTTRPAPPPVARRAPPPALVGRPAPVASAPVAAGPTRGRLSLKDATSGLAREPLYLLIYGVEGVGKTSFAASAPSPIIIGTEKGSAEVGGAARVEADSFEDVMGILAGLRNEPHSYKTVVLDTLGAFETHVNDTTCLRAGKPTLESFGYGKGPPATLAVWREFLRALEALWSEKKINIIMTAHAVCKRWKNPGDGFDRFTLSIYDKAAGMLKERAKAVLFCDFETATVEKDGRIRGVDTGRRLMHTRWAAAYDAKNRLWLPEELPLGWAPFARAVKSGADLRERFYAAIAGLPEEAREAAIEHMEQQNYAPEAAESVIAGIAASGK